MGSFPDSRVFEFSHFLSVHVSLFAEIRICRGVVKWIIHSFNYPQILRLFNLFQHFIKIPLKILTRPQSLNFWFNFRFFNLEFLRILFLLGVYIFHSRLIFPYDQVLFNLSKSFYFGISKIFLDLYLLLNLLMPQYHTLMLIHFHHPLNTIPIIIAPIHLMFHISMVFFT
jgi:hypothetical protein